MLLESLEFERTGGFNAGEQAKILELVRDNLDKLLNEWDQRFPPSEG